MVCAQLLVPLPPQAGGRQVTVDPMVKVAAMRGRVRLTDGRVVTLIGWPPNRARAKVLDAAYGYERVDKTEIVEVLAS